MDIPELNEFNRRFDDPVWAEVAEELLGRHRIGHSTFRRAKHGENIVFLVDERYSLKIYTPLKNGFHRERAGLEFADGKMDIAVPQIVDEGDIEGFYYLILTQIGGREITRAEWLGLDRGLQIGLVQQLAGGLKQLHSYDPSSFEFNWREFLSIQIDSALEKQSREGGNPEWLESVPLFLERHSDMIPTLVGDAFQHGDIHFGNIRVKGDGKLAITGIFDLADCIKGFHEYEFVSIGVLMLQGQGDVQREFFRAYGYEDAHIDHTLRSRLFLLTLLYEHSSLRRYAERLNPEAVNLNLQELERAIWSFV